MPLRSARPLNPAESICTKFGWLTKMSRMTGFPVSTIQSWNKAGHIAEAARGAVLRCALENAIPHTPDDHVCHLWEAYRADADQLGVRTTERGVTPSSLPRRKRSTKE